MVPQFHEWLNEKSKELHEGEGARALMSILASMLGAGAGLTLGGPAGGLAGGYAGKELARKFLPEKGAFDPTHMKKKMKRK